MADAVTSMLAIVVLIASKSMGDFLDTTLDILGSILVAKWALGLMSETGKT